MTAPADPAPLDATLSVTHAARLLGVHPNTVRSWSEEGRLRHYRINARGDRRYRAADLRQFLSDAERGMAMVRGRPPDTRTRHIGVATTARRPEGGRATESGECPLRHHRARRSPISRTSSRLSRGRARPRPWSLPPRGGSGRLSMRMTRRSGRNHTTMPVADGRGRTGCARGRTVLRGHPSRARAVA